MVRGGRGMSRGGRGGSSRGRGRGARGGRGRRGGANWQPPTTLGRGRGGARGRQQHEQRRRSRSRSRDSRDEGRERSRSPQQRQVETKVTTALCLIPPVEHWGEIQALREQFDPAFERWMPHVNLLYPFVRDQGPNLEAAATSLRQALATTAPFEASMEPSDMGSFSHGRNHTVWLRPEPWDGVVALQHTAECCFPQCDDLSGAKKRGSAEGFQPHLTLGKSQHRMAAQQWQQRMTRRVQFPVTHLHIISRPEDGSGPFQVKYSVPLGNATGSMEPCALDNVAAKQQFGRLSFATGLANPAGHSNNTGHSSSSSSSSRQFASLSALGTRGATSKADIGPQLFPLVQASVTLTSRNKQFLASKVTAKLLDKNPVEIARMIESRGTLENKIAEALEELEKVRGPDCVTANQASTLSTTGSALIDLFFSGMVRGALDEKIQEQMRAAWQESAEDCVRVVMHARDCRGGKGEKQCVIDSLMWLRRNKPKTYCANIRAFLKLGYYRDLLVIAKRVHHEKVVDSVCVGHRGELIELELLADDLRKDFDRFRTTNNVRRPASLSLAAKWAPNDHRKDHWNQAANGQLGKRLRRLCFPDDQKGAQKYRKMLSAMREHLKIVERYMCAREWSKIDFEAVPSRAHHLYKAAFRNNDAERYAEFIGDVKSGKKTIKAKGLHVHELARQYIGYYTSDFESFIRLDKPDDTTEAQWTAKVAALDKSCQSAQNTCALDRCLAICDVSGSMDGTPLEVSIALGILTSMMAQGPFHRKVITFSSEPKWQNVEGETLWEMVTGLKAADFSEQTDFLKAMRLILDTAVRFRVPPHMMPETLFVFSDMQFGAVSGCDPDDFSKTTFQIARQEYQTAGYKAPKIVFWNLAGDTSDVPADMNEKDVVLLSGFSSDLLKLFLGEKIPTTQMEMLQKAIDPYTAVIAEEERFAWR